MPKLSTAGRTIAIRAIAEACRKGTYRAYDGDGRELVRTVMPDEYELDGARTLRFAKSEESRVGQGGRATSFALFSAGGDALISGTIGRAIGKFVDAAMEDQQLYAGMLFDVDGFSYTLQFPE